MTAARDPDLLEGYSAIGAELGRLFGCPFNRFQLLRLSLRRVKPLPLDGYKGRILASRAALARWVEQERRRNGRTAGGGR